MDTAQTKTHPPFSGLWQPETEPARMAISEILREVGAHEDRERQIIGPDGTRRRRRKKEAQHKFETAVYGIVCETLIAAISEIEHGFRCPRSKGVLEKVDRNRPPALNPLLPQALDVLEALGVITQTIGYVGPEGERVQTVVRPGPKSFALSDAYDLTLDDFRQEWPGDEIVLRSAKGSDGAAGAEIDYVDTGATRQLRAEMQEINRHLRQADLSLRASTTEAVDPHQRKLRRIFTNGSFECGGRLYGGFWIDSLKAEERVEAILIEGKPVAELDYSACAMRILYGLAGQNPPSNDLYAIRGLEHAERDDVKALLAALTFVDEVSVRKLAPLVRKLCPDIRPPIDGGLEPLADAQALDRVLGLVKRHHAPIAAYIPSMIGHRVQRIESDILVRVLLMLIAKGITALPVHDAVLVRQDCVEVAKAIMATAFEEIAGVAAVVREKRGGA